jgi:hypothetical protein
MSQDKINGALERIATQKAADCLVNIVWTDDTQARLAHEAVAEALREERRDTLEEACKALCGMCRTGKSSTGTYNVEPSVEHLNHHWYHRDLVRAGNWPCAATRIRALIEKGPTNG